MTELEKAKQILNEAQKQSHQDLAAQSAAVALAYAVVDVAISLRELRGILDTIKTEMQLQRR